MTVTFDDRSGQDQALDGQYPSGVIDWGANQWWHSGPFGQFTTKSVSFNVAGITSRSFTVVMARRLVSIQAYNGGSASTTITLSCPGQPPKQATLAAGQAATIETGWIGTCTSVTVSSSNGWDTNFDNLVLDGTAPALTATPVLTFTPSATTIPLKTSTPTATATATRTSTPTVTRTPTPISTATPTATPVAPQTVTFDDRPGQDQPLNGQYPTGVIDWGTNGWWHAGPWGLFTTKSVSFNGDGITSRTFTFVTPRRLVSIKVYNGGVGSTTISLGCSGQPTKTQSVPAGQETVIATNWIGTCATVTVGSSNGWNSNFDDIAHVAN
jgi:hypothetical protein